MSKNLTRKGLAFGALVALGSTLIAGTPASAAGEVVFAPTTGTSYNTFATADFALSASLAPGQVAANITQLKYQIAGGAAAAVEYTVGAAAAAATTATNAATQVVASGAVAGTPAVLNIGLPAATAATATKSVVVTAFIDSDNDNVLDAGEFAQERTVTFKKLSEVAVTVSLTSPTAAETSVKATVAIADLNTEQTAAGTQVLFTATGQNLGAAVSAVSGVYSDTTAPLATPDVVTARAYYGADALGSAAAFAIVSAQTISQPTAAVVAGSNALASGVARTNSAFAVQATIKDTSAVVKSGVPVSVAISGIGTLTSTRTLSINGTVYNGTVAVPASISVTSDAAGLATVNLVTVGFSANDANLSVVFSAQSFTATVPVDFQDAAYTVVSTAAGSEYRTILEGGTTTFNYSVKDQFGVVIGSGARIKAVVGYSTPATSYVAVSAGVASVTVTDTAANTDADITVTTTLETQSAVDSNWSTAGTATNAAVQIVYVNAATSAAAFLAAPSAQALTLSTAGTIASPSVNIPGAAVTVAAKGFTFTSNGFDFVDTITVFADNNGAVPNVTAKSNTSGAQTVTWTVGSASRTATVTVSAATVGKTLTVTAPASATPGSTFTVTGKLVDAFGNLVVPNSGGQATFTVTYSGPGFVSGGLPTLATAAGEFSFQVLTGATDSGSGTVTVTYDADGSANAANAAITKTATVLIAAPEVAATIAGATAKINYTIDNAKGELVIIKVANKTVKRFVAYSNSHVFGMKAAKGSKAVKVYVAGDLVAAKTVSVK